MLRKIYSIYTLTIVLISMPWCPLQSKVATIHNGHDPHGYVDWHSWAAYLHGHPGYKPYQPVTDIKKHGCHWGAWVTFPQKIEAIQVRVGNISSPVELLRSKDFLVMYKHPGYYREAFLDYIVDNRYSLAQKKIAIYAMRDSPFTSCKESYELYKKKKIDLPLLEAIVAIAIANDWDDGFGALAKITKEAYARLKRLGSNIPKNSSLYKDIASILSTNKLPKSWSKYRMHLRGDLVRDYYNAHFSFYDVLTDAVRDRKDLEQSSCGGHLSGLETYPYFLMVMEHPSDYYPAHFELGPRRGAQYKPKRAASGIDVLRYKGYTDEEKSMAIFGMSQLGVAGSAQSSNYYAFIIEHAIDWYKLGNLSVHHLLELFICNFPTFYKYPFFILDYKDQPVQQALNKFIEEPTIPEGMKEVARKVKNGTLATKEEMDYMEGYRTFRQTHFTLYETIVPRG